MSDNALDLPYDFVFESKCLGGAHAKRISIDISPELLGIHKIIVERHASRFFARNASLFLTVGIECDDLKSICMCYLSSFMTHQSVLVEGYKRDKYFEDYAEKYSSMVPPDEEDLINKDQAVLMLFLRQRLSSLMKVVAKKRMDINGVYARDVIYRVDKECSLLQASSISWITKIEREKLGFFKVIQRKMEYIKNKTKNTQINSFFQFEGKTYYKHRIILRHNLRTCYEPEDSSEFENLKDRFNHLPETRRLALIKQFVKQNKDKVSKIEELAIAETLLKEPRIT